MGKVLEMTLHKALILLALPVVLSGCLAALRETTPSPQIMVASGETLLEARLPKLETRSPLKRVADDGQRTTWMSPDAITLAFEHGVLAATRGLGYDLMGAAVTPTLSALSAPTDATYRRQFRYLTGDNQSTWGYAGCQMFKMGSDQGFARFEERCRTHAQAFTNIYWLSAEGEIAQSQQWISPQIGSVHLRFVRNP